MCAKAAGGEEPGCLFQTPSMYLEFWAFINFVFNITYLIKIYVILNNEQF